VPGPRVLNGQKQALAGRKGVGRGGVGRGGAVAALTAGGAAAITCEAVLRARPVRAASATCTDGGASSELGAVFSPPVSAVAAASICAGASAAKLSCTP
jgi:hypothetical protein